MKLPPEIQTTIVDCLDCTDVEDRDTLLRLCLVSRVFRSLAQPRLFSYIDLHGLSEARPSAIFKLWNALQKPKLAVAVRHIRFRERSTRSDRRQAIRITQLLKPCKSLTAITVITDPMGHLRDYDELDDCLHEMPQLAYVEIEEANDSMFLAKWDAAERFGSLPALRALDIDLREDYPGIADHLGVLPPVLRSLLVTVATDPDGISDLLIVKQRDHLFYTTLRLEFHGTFGELGDLLMLLPQRVSTLELVHCRLSYNLSTSAREGQLRAPSGLTTVRLTGIAEFEDWQYIVYYLPYSIEDLHLAQLSDQIVRSLAAILKRMKHIPTKLVRLHIPSSGLQHLRESSRHPSYWTYKNRPYDGYCELWGEVVKDGITYAKNGGSELDELCADLGITVYPHGFYEAYGGEPTFRLKPWVAKR